MKRLVFLMILALLLCSCMPYGYVIGSVHPDGLADCSGVPVSTGAWTAYTKPDGSFLLVLPPGSYDVEAYLSGYYIALALDVPVAAGRVTNLGPTRLRLSQWAGGGPSLLPDRWGGCE